MSGVRRRTGLEETKDKEPDRDADGIQGHVERRAVAALDEALVNLVGHRVRDTRDERR